MEGKAINMAKSMREIKFVIPEYVIESDKLSMKLDYSDYKVPKWFELWIIPL